MSRLAPGPVAKGVLGGGEISSPTDFPSSLIFPPGEIMIPGREIIRAFFFLSQKVPELHSSTHTHPARACMPYKGVCVWSGLKTFVSAPANCKDKYRGGLSQCPLVAAQPTPFLKGK